jgi:hypothetical protein
MARQRVSDGVELADAILDHEIITKQLGDPRVLWYGSQVLVKEELETPMVGADGKGTTLEITPPMMNGLNQPNELALIGQ